MFATRLGAQSGDGCLSEEGKSCELNCDSEMIFSGATVTSSSSSSSTSSTSGSDLGVGVMSSSSFHRRLELAEGR